MKTFKFDQHELQLHDSSDRPIDHTRRAARAVLQDTVGQIAVMYFTSTGSYKLPGGGIDEGEEILNALAREIQEETGYTIDSPKELCVIEENRYICGMHQISYCFTARAKDFVGTQRTEKEVREGMELRWAENYDEAIRWIEANVNPAEGESPIGLAMMKLREKAILESAK